MIIRMRSRRYVTISRAQAHRERLCFSKIGSRGCDSKHPQSFDTEIRVRKCHAIYEDRVKSLALPTYLVICRGAERFIDQDLDFRPGLFVLYLDDLNVSASSYSRRSTHSAKPTVRLSG